MRDDLYVHLYYKNFMKHQPGQCHIGLGVGGSHVSKTLRETNVLNPEGIRTDVYGVWRAMPTATADDSIYTVLKKSTRPVTHAIVEAPWLQAQELQALMMAFPETHFIVRYHSQVGFLQVDPGAVKLIREYMYLQELNHNFQIAVNSERLGHFMQQVYNSDVLLLPNLYPAHRVNRKSWHAPGKLIRVGSFGALRLQKNHATSAAAALILARSNGLDLEFYVNSNRDAQTGVLGVLRDLFNNVPGCSLVEVPWAQWPEFRHKISHLDLHFQLSATESFNLTTADAISEGVPCVVGESIDWVPSDWIANIDDAYGVSQVAHKLLYDPHAAQRGLKALEKYIDYSLRIWLSHLVDGNRRTMPHHLSWGI